MKLKLAVAAAALLGTQAAFANDAIEQDLIGVGVGAKAPAISSTSLVRYALAEPANQVEADAIEAGFFSAPVARTFHTVQSSVPNRPIVDPLRRALVNAGLEPAPARNVSRVVETPAQANIDQAAEADDSRS